MPSKSSIDAHINDTAQYSDMVLGTDPPIGTQRQTQPVYEVIKRNDICGAFKDALNTSLAAVLARVDALIDLYAATAPSSLWTWDSTSRWDYDLWR